MKLTINLNWEDPLIDRELDIYYTRLHGEIDLESIQIFRNGHDYTPAFERLVAIHGDLWDDLKESIMSNEDVYEALAEICRPWKYY